MNLLVKRIISDNKYCNREIVFDLNGTEIRWEIYKGLTQIDWLSLDGVSFAFDGRCFTELLKKIRKDKKTFNVV